MTNFIKVADPKQLEKLFETIQDKLIILLFYTKNNQECKRALTHFEKSSLNHTNSYFLVIDIDHFQGECRYTKNIQQTPTIECYHMGNPVGSYLVSNDKDIEQVIQCAERYILSTSNMNNKNNSLMNQNAPMNQNTQLQQIQNQIMNNLQMQNPLQARQLMQNPALLQQMAQQQLIQQQQMMQQPQMMQQQPQMMQQHQMMPFMQQPNLPNIMQQLPMMPNTNTPFSQQAMPTLQQMQQLPMMPTNTNTPFSQQAMPTLQQMQQMFQIFQMMQQMGIINVQAPIQPQSHTQPQHQLSSDTNTQSSPTSTETTILPNGDKLVPLGNGKFGLVKNKNT